MQPYQQEGGSCEFSLKQNKRNQDKNTWDKMQETLGQTKLSTLYQIDCGMMLAFKQEFEGSVTTITGTLLHSNGALLTFAGSILKIITRQLNKINNQSPYWYSTSKGQLICLYKLFETQRNSIKNFILSKVHQTNLQLINLFYILGIKNFTQFHGRKQNVALWKMDALTSCLNVKKKASLILSQYQNRKKVLKEKVKAQGKAKQNGQGEGYIDIYQILPKESVQQSPCSEFTMIEEKQKIQKLDMSLKFDLSVGKFDLLISKENGQGNRQVQQKQIYLLKKTVKKTLQRNLKHKALAKLKRQIKIIQSIQHGKNFFPRYFVEKKQQQQQKNIKRSQGILNQSHYVQQNQMEQFSLYVQRLPCSLTFCITNDIFVFREIFNRFKEIVFAVEALHKSGIVHRDLKPQNIMISEKHDQGSKIKIIDFSDSALMTQKYCSQLSNNLGCSLPYSPFQCAFNCQHGVKSPAVDIWSLGVLLHELFYKQPPNLYTNNITSPEFFYGMSHNQLTITLTKKWYKKGFFGYLEEFIQHIIRSCLLLIHYQRMGIDLIKKFVLHLDQFLTDMEVTIQGSIDQDIGTPQLQLLSPLKKIHFDDANLHKEIATKESQRKN